MYETHLSGQTELLRVLAVLAVRANQRRRRRCGNGARYILIIINYHSIVLSENFSSMINKLAYL